MVEAIIWKNTHLELLDQRVLPFESRYETLHTAVETANAIRSMVVRGAPAIGVTAAYGLVLALRQDPSPAAFAEACDVLAESRPTAVNLFDAIEYMKTGLGDLEALANPAEKAESLAIAYHQDDLQKNHAIGKHGASVLDGQRNVLTHCNTGSLATSGWGTALGIIRQLHRENRLNMIYADETRPFLQGARLTVWECRQDGLPVKLVTDGMGGYLMNEDMVDCVIVGADRIAANGDAANKIGTSMLAMAAKFHDIPFIVAAPTTTIDRRTPSGKDIPIEQRPTTEVSHVRGQAIVEEDTACMNPAFDVTPASLISAIITEEGVFRYPYDFSKAAKQA
ncbi:S-methyl-5-thioribose-1-phosphate isomerase [Sulfidibacter corallicola]|uniref:Methylthioribose-1-phosphate isomerase n=1 Tax=Sulfidibacter corallicola TaxID=2818388 RepID=A0A8A4TUJ9_SULCO|nr:S-methyl-5-thioribose-1-phosphate isomerase [Sulfidibacter corallicola]QTD53190.1 S-methyl-5-thioribose-1-phosphate isomerase [Sulfidibacter corallicola]